jgi:hypothetical protein
VSLRCARNVSKPCKLDWHWHSQKCVVLHKRQTLLYLVPSRASSSTLQCCKKLLHARYSNKTACHRTSNWGQTGLSQNLKCSSGLPLQEFSLKHNVACSTSAARRSQLT